MKLLAKNLLPKNKITKIILIAGLIFFTGITCFYLGALGWIKHEANELANETSVAFEKDKIESLLEVIDSKNYTLKEKNNAIWALGVLKDKKALPILEALHTGEECNHDKELCQYEIHKAILKIKGNFRGSWQASKQ